MLQATLKDAVYAEGVGAHSGDFCDITIMPASEDFGVIFVRGDLDEDCYVKANYANIEETPLCTRLSNKTNFSVSTVEHLLAALYGIGVSNAFVQSNGGEIPMLDGSSIQFVEKVLNVGVKEQSSRRKILKITETVRVEEDSSWVSLSPAESFSINIECDYTKHGLMTSPLSFNFATGDFVKEIAPARTFGFFADAEFLRKNNLARGVSLENALVFGEHGYLINDKKLRFHDEAMRHKILDVIGDLSLSGCLIQGRFDGFRPSHRINHLLLRAVFKSFDNYTFNQ
ncbi:MAG: UDP-3-O-acyl-N-acetylglucosamine deacetylase [Holosporaceae bacterium]|jgi:UDP-3-O-[3-hydroxymyristoyl] N-acetylglucosamine deacetylase|nr:UDP-3-O-acyl-N-acetylglucosamine deacetylase [Holosporaceae bacterium]